MPNYWAENFIYGFDPKFIMAITAKVNMVLHGDGSAHIFKYDAFSEFSKYSDTKLRVASDTARSIKRKDYNHDTCETFDVVLSNPPFGITLSSETKSGLKKAFCLPETSSSESLFIERCFQLLKPKGRLGIVLPESVFNAADSMTTRLFLYRGFDIKAIVSLPRNMFIDTPTLTSLLFAQKKSKNDIEAWDEAWNRYYEDALKTIESARSIVTKSKTAKYKSAEDVQKAILQSLAKIVNTSEWVVKKGRNGDVLPFQMKDKSISVDDACKYYSEILKSASIEKMIIRYAFEKTSKELNKSFDVFCVNEVGYKLSKRKEKAKPNQLCSFVGVRSGKKIMNLHLSDEEAAIVIDTMNPSTVLDIIRLEVQWND